MDKPWVLISDPEAPIIGPERPDCPVLSGLANLALVMLYSSAMGQMGLKRSAFGAPAWIRVSAGAFALSLLLPILFLPFKIQDGHGVVVYLWSLPLMFNGGRFMASIALTGVGPEQVIWPISSESAATLAVIIWFLGSLLVY